MSLKGLIFDLDGVIVFTDQYHYKAWKQMADEKGIYFDQEINNRLRGVSRMDSLEIILERYEGHPLSDEEKQKMAEDVYKRQEKQYAKDLIDEGCVIISQHSATAGPATACEETAAGTPVSVSYTHLLLLS